MELKFTMRCRICCNVRSNRTFMELKLIIDELIVSQAGSNRTFMELKYGNDICENHHFESSNRTFMELKYILIGKTIYIKYKF